MVPEVALNNAIAAIKDGSIELTDFLNEISTKEERNALLDVVRANLSTSSNSDNLSIYCGIIHECNDESFLPLLWQLLSDSHTKGRRGSLVFAMENMNPIAYFEQLVDLVINDTFEVMSNCLAVIDSLEGYVDGETIERCTDRLASALKTDLPNWKVEPIRMLLDELLE